MKKLQLKKEIVADMNKTAMGRVNGGGTIGCLTGVYPTLDTPCATVQPCEVQDQSARCPMGSTPCTAAYYPTHRFPCHQD